MHTGRRADRRAAPSPTLTEVAMILIECWKDLTPEQREALVKACNDRCAGAEAALAEEKKATAALAARVSALAEEKARLEESFRADFDRMAEEIRQLTVAGVAARNKLLFLGQHLPEFVGDFLATYEPFTDAALTPEMVKRRTVAREIMRELEPFGQ